MNIALILAGGSGSRFGGDIPKQYLEVGGKPVIAYCLRTFSQHEQIDKIQIVADEQWHAFIEKCTLQEGCTGLQGFSAPGENRQLSIWNGLQDILEYGWELEEGESTAVLDEYGILYLIECTGRSKNDPVSIEEVKDNINKTLREERYEKIIEERAKDIRAEGDMERIFFFMKKHINE